MVLTGLFVIYFLLLIIFLAGWSGAMRERKFPKAGKDQLISVVIPVRNEELTIANLLADLSRQDYKRFEVIVVNDDSEDETLWVVSRFALKNLQVIHSKGKGKKAAITAGVRKARGTIIVTTDADCSVPSEWLSAIHDFFRAPKVMMAFGGVRMEGDKSFFDSLQAMEFASLIGTGAATAAVGFPTMCNGANLAFRRRVFSEVDGYEGNLEVASGDDEFLMRKIHNRYPKGVHFMRSPATVVSTGTQADVRAFVNQRIRWASKWRYSTSFTSKALAVAVLVMQTGFIANWFLIFSPLILKSLFLLSVKMILEAAFLLQVCHFLRIRWNWLAFFSLQFIYPLYVIGVGTASFFTPYRWKNRIFKP